MTPATLTWFVVGAFLVYIVAVDPNVYTWLVLQSKRLRIEMKKAWFRIRYHPDSPWVRYSIRKNADRMAREIIKENENR